MATHHHRHPKIVSLARNPAATATQTRVQGRLRCLLSSYPHLFCVSPGFYLLTSSLETSHDHLHAVSYPPLSKNPYDPGCNNHIFRKNQLHPQNTMPIF